MAESLKLVQGATTHELLIGERSVNVQQGIEEKIVQAIYRLLPPKVQSGATPSVYRVPGFPKLYAITADSPSASSTDYGLSLYIFEQKGEAFRQVFRSRGMADSYILRPTFFLGQNRTLIMAETGDESGTWALDAFEVKDRKVAYLGTLEAARRDPKNDCWANPIHDARIEFVGSTYVVHLRGEIYVHPDKKDEKKLLGYGWHRFALERTQFVFKP
jgi:hypothetical protein